MNEQRNLIMPSTLLMNVDFVIIDRVQFGLVTVQ